MTGFEGFPTEGLSFLTDLGHNDKVWFTENRSTYDRAVVAPAKKFVDALAESLQATISPTIVGVPKTNGSIAPINNDLRFSPDKSPYKDHLLLRFWDGPNKKTAPTLMVRIAEDQIGFSSAVALADIARWRELVAADSSGEALVAALAPLQRIDGLDVADDQLKKVPAPYPADHPRADLLRHRGMFYIRWPEPTTNVINTPDFIGYCTSQLERCASLHQWFVAHLNE